jgi:hypothetical protein
VERAVGELDAGTCPFEPVLGAELLDPAHDPLHELLERAYHPGRPELGH